MGIEKRNSKTKGKRYRAVVYGRDGSKAKSAWLDSREAAKRVESELLQRREKVTAALNSDARKITLKQFAGLWFREARAGASRGHVINQKALLKKHVLPLLGDLKLQEISARDISKCLTAITRKQLSAATRNHVYLILHKIFKDARLIYGYRHDNPVLPEHKVRMSQKEAKFLNVVQAAALMRDVRHSEYGTAIRCQYFLGLRFGELVGLRVCDLDFTEHKYTVRQVFDRHGYAFRNYPKGRNQHTNYIPLEIEAELKLECIGKAATDLVFKSPGCSMLYLRKYNRALAKHCKAAGVPVISSHGLRHSTGELMLKHGATKDELQRFFDHKSQKTTERYIHGSDHRMSEISRTISLEKYADVSDESQPNNPKRNPKSGKGLRVIQGGAE